MKAMAQLLFLVLIAVTACPRPPPGPGEPQPHPGVLECGSRAVEACAPGALPGVNGCLAGTGDVTDCLLGLIKPVGCVTYGVVACLTRHEGAAAEHAYRANPEDTRDHWRAQRAREFLLKTGAQFGD